MDEIKINDNICSSFKLWESDAPGRQEGLDIPTLHYCRKLHELGVSTEMHIYTVGIHGLGLANDEKHNCEYIQSWAKNLEAWLKELGYIKSICNH